MERSFDGWVRVVTAGALAVTAYLLWRALDIGDAVMCLVPAVMFVLIPERLAFRYRAGAGVPRWSKPLSVTHVEGDGPAAPEPAPDTFDGYVPRLAHLSSAYTSIVGYLALVLFGRRERIHLVALGVLVASALLLYIVGRNDEQRRIHEDGGPIQPIS